MAGIETFDARRKAVDAAADWLVLRARADDAPLPSGLLGPVEINITRTPCAGKAGGLHAGAQMDEAFLRLDVADGKDRYTEP